MLSEIMMLAEVAAETPDSSAFSDFLQGVVNLLPFPWNVVGGAIFTAGAAIFAWKATKMDKEPEEEEKKDN